MKRDFVLAELAKIPGLSCPKPEGAFYVFPVISSYYGAPPSPPPRAYFGPANLKATSRAQGTVTPSGAKVQDSNDVCVFILDVRPKPLEPPLLEPAPHRRLLAARFTRRSRSRWYRGSRSATQSACALATRLRWSC